jgi:transposase
VTTLATENEEVLRQRATENEDVLRQRVVELESSLARTTTSLARVTDERDRLRRAYMLLKEQYELLRRQIFAAKAERIDASQLELEFAETKAKLEALSEAIERVDEATSDVSTSSEAAVEPPPPPPGPKNRPKPSGRRDLRDEIMEEKRIEILDPELEGKVERIGFEESCRQGYRRGGPVRIVVARATYKCAVESDNGTEATEFVTVKTPKEMVERGLLAPSLIAHLLVAKYRFGLPFHRLAEMLRSQGVRVDDSTMCRYAEHVGATLGCIVDACAKEAKETAFCLSTDATGVAIQPTPIPGKRQACRRGHFFVVLADQDHVFFEFQAEHTSDAVCRMFKGFTGHIQADAHAIYNAIFRGEARANPDDKIPEEVGCWSHARRRFWNAATIAKDPAAREALLRLHMLFELEQQWAKLPPSQRHQRRQLQSRPLLDDFFAWAEPEFERAKGIRGLVASAFGYAVRQRGALCRFLDDGRLPMTNNHSERALRPIAVGRSAWLFFGSDDHAAAAANLFSLVASCELHRLDFETYLAEMIRIVPLWPRDRYLELAPKYWARTRARLDENELADELGPITVPPAPAAEQAPPD